MGVVYVRNSWIIAELLAKPGPLPEHWRRHGPVGGAAERYATFMPRSRRAPLSTGQWDIHILRIAEK
jgi:hypothetical protein